MTQESNNNYKTTTKDQSWRKKPRKFAPKSRLGCKTCKIRRVKCDLSVPSCLRCKSTGRTCDGYGDQVLPQGPDVLQARATRADVQVLVEYDAFTETNTYRSLMNVPDEGVYLTSQIPESFLVIPSAAETEAQAMHFFERNSLRHLNEYHPCESWRQVHMLLSQTVPAVRHAAIALGLLGQHISSNVPGGRFPPDDALLHYNRAIKLLLTQHTDSSPESTAVQLLVCYLFACFDHTALNDVQARKHLRGGVKLLANFEGTASNMTSAMNGKALRPDLHPLVRTIAARICRLDMQAVTSIVDWKPSFLTSDLPASEDGFRSLDQAADCLGILMARGIQLQNLGQTLYPQNQPPTPLPSVKEVTQQLEKWLHLFEALLHSQASPLDPEQPRSPRVSLLRLQHTIVFTLLRAHGPNLELEYDRFLPEFQACLALIKEIAAAHERYSSDSDSSSAAGKGQTFTPELGILPVLYVVGVKCRHLALRREVVGILQRLRMREASWDSDVAARVLVRVIDLEEVGDGTGRAQRMEDVPLSRRVEYVSWLQVLRGHIVHSLEFKYTWCAKSEVHEEKLFM